LINRKMGGGGGGEIRLDHCPRKKRGRRNPTKREKKPSFTKEKTGGKKKKWALLPEKRGKGESLGKGLKKI